MTKLLRRINLAILAAVIPCLHGCGSGGGAGELASLLFGSTTSAFSGSGSLPPGIVPGPEVTTISDLPLLHNPEPSSMILLGVGVAAMTVQKIRQNRKTK